MAVITQLRRSAALIVLFAGCAERTTGSDLESPGFCGVSVTVAPDGAHLALHDSLQMMAADGAHAQGLATVHIQ